MKRILVVDDSYFMRIMLQDILTKNGFNVIGEADNGLLAVEKYKELLPDIVTLDITMKEMNGLEALKEIINFDKNAKVLMVSSMGQKSFIQDAVTSGAKGFLIKPFKSEMVVRTIASL